MKKVLIPIAFALIVLALPVLIIGQPSTAEKWARLAPTKQALLTDRADADHGAVAEVGERCLGGALLHLVLVHAIRDPQIRLCPLARAQS